MWAAVAVGVGTVVLAAALGVAWVHHVRGQLQRAVDAAALAGAGTARVWREVDALGTVYSVRVVCDPEWAEGESKRCLDENLKEMGVGRSNLREDLREIVVEGNVVKTRVVLVVSDPFPFPWPPVRLEQEAVAVAEP